MKNADKPAYPNHPASLIGKDLQGADVSEWNGLTKREIFAMAAMQSLVTVHVKRLTLWQRVKILLTGSEVPVTISHGDCTRIAEVAIKYADELLKQLES